MPQMVPMSLTLLFIMFIMTFLILNSINFFTTIYNAQSKKYLKTLFSSFASSTSLPMTMNWLSTFLAVMFIPSSYWLIPSGTYKLWNKMLLILQKEFKTLLGNSNIKGSTIMFYTLFSMIVFNNFLGLFPYIFTSTSHPNINPNPKGYLSYYDLPL